MLFRHLSLVLFDLGLEPFEAFAAFDGFLEKSLVENFEIGELFFEASFTDIYARRSVCRHVDCEANKS